MRMSHLLGIAALALGLAPQLIEPPFVREWTQSVGDQAFVIAVQDGLVYYGSAQGLGALDLATGQRRWSSLLSRRIPTAEIQGRNLYAISQTEKTAALVAIDLKSGRARTLARLAPGSSHLAIGSERLYVLDESATLRAYAPNSGTVIWSRALQSGRTRRVSLAQVASTSDGLYLGLDEAGEFGVDPKDGKILWSRPARFAGLYPPIVIGGDVITQHDALRRITVRTGKVVWKADQGYGDAVLVASVLVSTSQKHLLGRDVTDGRVLWRLPLRDRDVSYGGTPAISDDERAWILRRPVVCVTKDGREEWNRSEPFTRTPAYADHERVVTIAGERILGYVAGALPPLPTFDPGKRTVAERLAAQFEILDDAERRQLGKLAPFSFRPLLARYTGWAKTWDANPESENSFPLYCLMTDALPLLHETCRKQDTGAILTALSSLGERSSWREELERILQAKGDPAGYVPVLVKKLRRLPLKQRGESAALDATSHSSHPEAVAFMLAALRDPAAAAAWRREAFRHLAGTGSTKGVDTVRAARPRRGPRKPWFDRIKLSALERDGNLTAKRDSRGRTWVLFHSGVLGNYSDLFLAQKLGSKWGKPLFTGAWMGPTFHSPAPKAFRGIPIAKLLSTEWIRIIPNDTAIRRDVDRDSLTDVVESRLGTDPRKADTDGDGLADAVDPCPNAAPRPPGDSEKIIAACVEARFFLEDWGVPAVLSAEGVKPFELYGYASPMIWQIPGRASPLERLYGGGVNVIGFHQPDLMSRQKRPMIEYSPDRKTARTTIRRYSGGLNGDGIEVRLKKIGDDWFAVDLQMRYVS